MCIRDSTQKEREWITGFRCRDAGCFKPSDRAIVLQVVRDKFGSEDKFDEFVHVQLLKVLERSKREYSSKLWDVAPSPSPWSLARERYEAARRILC